MGARPPVGILEQIDPGSHRRVKGLRLVTSYGMAAMGGVLVGGAQYTSLSALAGGFALWASVSEGQATRIASSRDLLMLNAAAVLGSGIEAVLGPLFGAWFPRGAEFTLVSGAFLVGYLKRFGTLGAGLGSQVYIGQLLAYGAGLVTDDLWTVVVTGMIATVASLVPRLLSGPAEQPPSAPRAAWPPASRSGERARDLRMGLQAALAALVIALLNAAFELKQSAWAVTACTYVIAGSTAGTLERVRRRIIGTTVGVPLGLALTPIMAQAPLLAWFAAALAMVVYAVALPERYDIACGAYAFTLMVTLTATGAGPISLLAARAWETMLGGAIGVVAALLVWPLGPVQDRTGER